MGKHQFADDAYTPTHTARVRAHTHTYVVLEGKHYAPQQHTSRICHPHSHHTARVRGANVAGTQVGAHARVRRHSATVECAVNEAAYLQGIWVKRA